ncbi:pilus (MSHA type) biogenesis protein MshL [Uliginosibacterium sp. 31-16]|uniref:pilus (MSHA type) biogenesis protein MshL n=1 Tax=Uliginosibacterium sp. 31-16 TaxID=3068315 RepID=UPI00273D8E06|nr:pilus (MSHA type) biogenesis protein MshL [Uliginosibacterium sp. 31-16]MDP5238571.1 pilus (MSHA type) biogenesis protein MshL [Uliginosibacterium sp. 31-16]
MNNVKTPKARSCGTTRGKSRALPLLGMLLIMGGCASSEPRSVASMPEVDQAALKRIREHVVAESKKLSEAQDGLRAELATSRAAVPLPMTAPQLDPLESRTISVSMNNATISQLVVALADQSKLNLIVDPSVLAMDKRADLHLKDVTLREAVNNVLQAFDLVGQIKGNTLRVDLMDERIFSLDFLNTNTNLDISAGGNVFGSNTGGTSGGSGNALRGNVILNGGSTGKSDPYDQIENAVKRIVGDVQTRRQDAEVDSKGATTFSLDKMSGSLYVKARPSQVRSIEKLLERTQKVLKRQVQIEAQLVDVQLSDGFSLGVDWNILRNQVAGTYGTSPMTLGPISANLPAGATANLPARSLTIPSKILGSATDAAMGVAFQSNSFSVALDALRSFGNVKVLSNPSVQVRNGTPALLSVGTSTRYVSKTTVTTTTGTATSTAADVQTDSVFAGVMVGVVPFVRDDGRVELMVHPMQTDVEATSLALVDVGNGSKVTLPVVSYKGMTTTLNVSDGDTVLIGGLIDQRSSNADKGAPGLSDVPYVGWAFGNQKKSHNSREMVMVLRVRVL